MIITCLENLRTNTSHFRDFSRLRDSLLVKVARIVLMNSKINRIFFSVLDNTGVNFGDRDNHFPRIRVYVDHTEI